MSRSKQKKKSRSRYQESAKEQPNEEEFCSLVQVQRTQSTEPVNDNETQMG